MYISNDRSKWASQIIKKYNPEARSIIELGCNDGATLHGLMQLDTLSLNKLHGVDYKNIADKLIKDEDFVVCDLNSDVSAIADLIYNSDVILMLDVLEHLYFPEEFLLKIKKIKSKESTLILSMPNSSSVRMLFSWLTNDFPREDIGFFDRTHRSWFSLKSISNFSIEHYEVIDEGYIYSNKFLYRLIQFIYPSRFTSQLYVVLK
ncbi:MAG: class I SAM-dependent methyltransferase [Methylococcaceae bacterium]|nr:class I SAM-dependent methyltransferase [Methylococcaceae bacterium]